MAAKRAPKVCSGLIADMTVQNDTDGGDKQAIATLGLLGDSFRAIAFSEYYFAALKGLHMTCKPFLSSFCGSYCIPSPFFTNG